MSSELAQPGRWDAPFQRRRHARVTVTVPVEYRITAEPAVPPVPAAAPARPGPRTRRTVATSVGGGGLLVETGERLPVGTRLAVTVYLPASSLLAQPEPVACEARVVWTDIVSEDEPDRYHCGVEFLDIAAEGRARVVAFTQRHEATAAVL
jgi:c-di-GMP-binding flagellar brake protein YcgR